jgi:hypothetical protein
MDVIQRVFSLRRSSEHAVVSEAGRTDSQRRLHIQDDIEDWLLERITTAADDPDVSSLFILSGNAGDGKSDLLLRLQDRVDMTRCEMIRDATQSESPDEDQIARLAEFLRPFSDEPREGLPVHLIAMNTGMAISFFEGVASRPELGRFSLLDSVVKQELGLGRQLPEEDPPWPFEIVNLDRRDLLEGPFFEQMLDRLDPDGSQGLFAGAPANCKMCAAREICFVRTNLELLRDERTRSGVRNALRRAAMEQGVHFSPRNLWDGLSWFIAGDPDFFGSHGPSCEALGQLSDTPTADLLPAVHRRLLWHSLFCHPDGADRLRGGALDALRSADPAPRTQRRCHDQEALIYAGPESERMHLVEIADEFAPGGAQVLRRLATALEDEALFAAVRGDLLLGVARRAACLDWPGPLSDELRDEDAEAFDQLLEAYAQWGSGARPEPSLMSFTRDTLRDGIAKVFGVARGQDVYFRLDAFSPTPGYPAYVRVDLSVVSPQRDGDVERGRGWLEVLRYRPGTVAVELRSGAGASRFHVDLPLFRLLRHVAAGYSASSLDLEAFYALRFACERLGGAAAEADDVVLRETESGEYFHASAEHVLGERVFTFEKLQ